MKFKTPILHDKEGNAIAWFEHEISAELIAELRWGWAHALKGCEQVYRTPIIEEEE